MKKPTSTSHKNPISIKAYNEFTRRIRCVFGKPGDADEVIQALDKYLDDEPDYGRGLNSRTVIGFSFLLYDVNQAILRSRRARERAALRRAAKEEKERRAVNIVDVAAHVDRPADVDVHEDVKPHVVGDVPMDVNPRVAGDVHVDVNPRVAGDVHMEMLANCRVDVAKLVRR